MIAEGQIRAPDRAREQHVAGEQLRRSVAGCRDGIRDVPGAVPWGCLLYTSDAADDPLCVDLGGRRII